MAQLLVPKAIAAVLVFSTTAALHAQFRGNGNGNSNGGPQSPNGAPFVPPSAPSFVIPRAPLPTANSPSVVIPPPQYPQGNVHPSNRMPPGTWVNPPSSTTTNRIPGNVLPNAPANVAPASHSTWSHAPRGFITNNSAVTTAANSAITATTQPAIQQHLQRQGQNVQTWTITRQENLHRFHQQNAERIEQFVLNRNPVWTQFIQLGPDRVRLARERGPAWNSYRQNLTAYRFNRGAEVRDRLRDTCDPLFTADWWSLHLGRPCFIGTRSPWWWWNRCAWTSAVTFCGFGWSQPVYYDYGTNVIIEGDVYVDGQDSGPAADYAQQAIDLANPQAAVADPLPPAVDNQASEWQPFGVYALTQEKEGDAIMFLQLAVNAQGQLSGAFTNTLAGDTEPIRGAIDPVTQKAAWHVGDTTNTVFEAGTANLTQDVVPVLIHFGTQTTQTWLLVRLASPDLPNTTPNPAPEN